MIKGKAAMSILTFQFSQFFFIFIFYYCNIKREIDDRQFVYSIYFLFHTDVSKYEEHMLYILWFHISDIHCKPKLPFITNSFC